MTSLGVPGHVLGHFRFHGQYLDPNCQWEEQSPETQGHPMGPCVSLGCGSKARAGLTIWEASLEVLLSLRKEQSREGVSKKPRIAPHHPRLKLSLLLTFGQIPANPCLSASLPSGAVVEGSQGRAP